MSPNVYIVAGPNGAGKTTFARKFLPAYARSRTFVNADLIAQGISPLEPEAAAFRAGRLMLEEIAIHARRGIDFGFETTLSGRSHLALIRDLKRTGYRAHLYYLRLPSPKLALARVKLRVESGGHNVPPDVVARRFDRSLHNFFQLYRDVVDDWTLFDNSGDQPEIIAQQQDGLASIIQAEVYSRLMRQYGGV